MAGSAVTKPGGDLTAKQRALVDAIAEAASNGIELSREEAGTAAGYGSGETARVSASRALALPHVRTYLMEQLRAVAASDAPSALVMLRHLRSKGRSERVKLDATLAALRISGLDSGATTGPTGPAVTLNLHVSGDIATLLSQRPVIEHEAQVVQGLGEGEHHLAEAVGGQAEGEGEPATPPPAPRARQRQAATGGQKRPTRAGARAPHTISPPKTRGSGKRKDGKDG